MFVKFLIVFHLVVTGNCFLLDGTPNNGGQTQTNNQFLTLSEFLQEKKTLQLETESLRHDLDKTISLLTKQLKQKFDLLDHKVEENSKKNDTYLDYVPMDMYLALEQKFNQLQNANSVLTGENNMMKNELRLLQNVSLKHDRKIRDLQQLGNIKPLQEIGTLQNAVQTNTATIQSLSMNERARSQDFLALYNLTTEFKKDVINQLSSIQINHNVTIDEIRSKIDTSEKESNSSIALLKKRIEEKVALTSHPTSGGTVKAGNIIKFNDVKFSVGINNLSTYKSSGKFVCESSGLYLMSVSIASYKNGNPQYGIILNGNFISLTEGGYQSGANWRTATSVVSRYLYVNDTIWVYARTDIYIAASIWSQFTILKIN
ncbi:Hypothetical predicted protein [Mytilus galloprovincialis]|uniref:C1q domain-containing protein n=1 Tax=Mytilus galloprovincialis TaxID=29158 RepID=A0A8B6DQ95_MYTGA|nr:Hypothetical predicted protein [Mytilus galloprovincialis]